MLPSMGIIRLTERCFSLGGIKDRLQIDDLICCTDSGGFVPQLPAFPMCFCWFSALVFLSLCLFMFAGSQFSPLSLSTKPAKTWLASLGKWLHAEGWKISKHINRNGRVLCNTSHDVNLTVPFYEGIKNTTALMILEELFKWSHTKHV